VDGIDMMELLGSWNTMAEQQVLWH